MTEQLFARTIHGIEWIAAAEISSVGSVSELAHREVHFTAEPGPAMLTLGTVDDVFLTCARIDGIGHERAALIRLEEAARSINIRTALSARAACGAAPGEPKRFEVVASFLGARNFNRYDIEDAIARGLASQTGWDYRERRSGFPVEADLAVRAHLREGEALIGVRLSRKPLHRRPWKTESPKGSLHPPLARAMVMLAQGARSIVDPFCGAGTIPIEAAALGLRAFASDIDETVVGMAARNAARAGAASAFVVADAARAPFGTVDALVTNAPWGRSATLRGDPKDLASVLEHAATAVVLGDDPPVDGALRQTISLMGAHPRLVATTLPADLAAWHARAADAGLV